MEVQLIGVRTTWLNSQELCMELKFSAQPRAAVGERDG